MRSSLVLPLLFAVSLTCFCQTNASRNQNPQLRNPIEGSQIFQHYCARCHGADGQDSRSVTAALKQAAPDLTVIAQKNNGKFPYRRVRDIIEGTDPRLSAHSDHKMPVWGPIFHEVDADQDWGEVRLENVTQYIQSIQRK